MRFFRSFSVLAICFCCLTFLVNAQNAPTRTAKATEQTDAYGIPINQFPTAPNQESARSVVNYNLDYMGLLPGKNLLHKDKATGVRLYARVNHKRNAFDLIAQDKEGKDLPIKIDSAGRPGCVFATPGAGWVNVICSQQMKYAVVKKKKNKGKSAKKAKKAKK